MKIIVVSDIHLGYENSDPVSFGRFLDEQLQRKDIQQFIILGDFIDMWRRDVSGLFLENHDILEKILKLQNNGIPVSVVAGNHDYHLLQLKNHGYPLGFVENLTLQSNGITYNFMHGWEFDHAQQPTIMELFCHNYSDDGGEIRSKFWDLFKLMGHDIKELVELITQYGGTQAYLDHLFTPPKNRLLDFAVETNAREKRDKLGNILIFGHTHRPFVSSKGDLANSGSWVKDEAVYNTYVEIEGKNITLKQYGKGDITSQLVRDF